MLTKNQHWFGIIVAAYPYTTHRTRNIELVSTVFRNLLQSTSSSSGSSSVTSLGLPKLPIDYVRSELVTKIREHDILIVMGETGSGKTTQLPQFIQDARLIQGQIGITQVCRFKCQ